MTLTDACGIGALLSLAGAGLTVAWDRQYRRRLFEHRNRSDRDWWAWYRHYLKSKAWRERREGILLRAEGRCEVCGFAKPIQVHHVTYERVGFELPEDLAATCFDCHKLQHPGKRI